MAQRRQRGWLKKESRIPGETWVLYFRTTRRSDGRRVENKIPIGLIRDLPDKRSAWAEVERLHLPINPVDSRRGAHLATSYCTTPNTNWSSGQNLSTQRRIPRQKVTTASSETACSRNGAAESRWVKNRSKSRSG
jgi:hypothetical protein